MISFRSKSLAFMAIISLMLVLVACQPATPPGVTGEILLQGRTMGTTYSIKFVAPDKVIQKDNLYQQVNELLNDINLQMSTYIDDSELSQFNQMRSTQFIPASRPLFTVIEEAIRLGKLTGGKLDVTVGPLVNLWGFGPDKRPETIPQDELLSSTMQRVGIDKLFVQDQRIAKARADLYVDLSTIAKGYAVDAVAELLLTKGISNFLVEIGGEMRVSGLKSNGNDWRVAIEKPVSTERAVEQILIPGNNAVATSGDYRNYYEFDGVRYSHIIDPTTGRPINHLLVSVTVITDKSMTADGLSTAIMVMGPEEGLAFAQQHNIAVYLVSKSDNGFDTHMTEQFKQYIAK